MARARTVITQSWASIFNGPGFITVAQTGDGVLLINNSAADETALAVKSTDGPRQQIEQKLDAATYMKATGDGWVVITDTSGLILLPRGK